MSRKQHFYPIIPGQALPEDWYQGSIPSNLKVGANSMVDSSFCFKSFFSSLNPGMLIGDHCTFWRTALAVEEQGYLEIGNYCYIANASIVCSSQIRIGNHVFIAGGVTIADSDFHPLDPALRLADTLALSPIGERSKRISLKSDPVYIDDGVWIGFNATVLKGVRLGKGATIMPGSLVIKDVPAGAMVAGNPAEIVKN